MSLLRKLGRFIIGLLIGLVIGVSVLSLLAYLLRDRLLAWLRDQLSQQVAARITLQDISVSGWRGFPALMLQLKGIVLSSFEGDTLLTCESLHLYLNFYEALIEKRYRIIGLHVEGPELRLRWGPQGRLNWGAILRPTADTVSTAWRIERLSVHRGRLLYEDRKAQVGFEIESLSVKAAIGHGVALDTTWQVQAQGQTRLRYLYTPATKLREAIPVSFAVWGAYLEGPRVLLVKRLSGSFYAFRSDLSGQILWKGDQPWLQLRLHRLEVDFARLSMWWSRWPPEWSAWPGHISVAGLLQGPVGQGRLPAVEVEAYVRQRKPFLIREYPLQGLYAKVGLRWVPLAPAKSKMSLDSLWLWAADDTLVGRGDYHFQKETWVLRGVGRLSLPALRLVGIDSLEGRAEGRFSLEMQPGKWRLTFSGQANTLAYGEAKLQAYRGSLHIAQHDTSWYVEAQGRIKALSYPPWFIREGDINWGPSALHLSNLRGTYDTLPLEVPSLVITPAQGIWEVPTLWVKGHLHVPRLFFPLPFQADADTAPGRTFILDMQVSADTLVWERRLYGPLRAAIGLGPDTMTLQIQHLGGVAGGLIQGALQQSQRSKATHWQLHLRAEHVQIPRLRRDFPVLDSLLPLLPHLRGQAQLELRAVLPQIQSRVRWAEAVADATLRLRDFSVEESPYTYKLFSLIPLTDFRRIQVGEVQTHLRLQDGVIRLDTTLLSANEWRLWISGSHTLRGELRYHLLVEVPRNLFIKRGSRVPDVVEEAEGERLELAIQVGGTAENPHFQWAPHFGRKPRTRSMFLPSSPAISPITPRDQPYPSPEPTHQLPTSNRKQETPPTRRPKRESALPVEENPR